MACLIPAEFLAKRQFLQVIAALDTTHLRTLDTYELLSWYTAWKFANPIVVNHGMTYDRFLGIVLTPDIWNPVSVEIVDFEQM